jgi:Ca2+-binding RTX toxin-like protein
MELFTYNSSNGNVSFSTNPANISLNGNLLNSSLEGLFNLAGTDSGLFNQIGLSRAPASQSLDILSTNLNSIVSRVADNTTTSGNIVSVVGAGNTLNATGENATLSVVGDNNVLNGGSGNNTFSVAGEGNTVTGGSGNDTFSAVGRNTLIGGEGVDTFVLPSIYSSSVNTAPTNGLIVDFKLGTDKLQLPTVTTTTGATTSFRIVNYNELTFTQKGQNTDISYQGNPLAELQNISTSQLQETDFVQPQNTSLQGITISS